VPRGRAHGVTSYFFHSYTESEHVGSLTEVFRSSSSIFHFKIVGDNIDKEVKQRDRSSDHQAQSLHYFHSSVIVDDTAGAPGVIWNCPTVSDMY
jgi:hypothetical protein